MAENSGLPTFDQLEERFAFAAAQRLTTYNWVPPDWNKLTADTPDGKRRLPADTCKNEGPFDKSIAGFKERLDKQQQEMQAGKKNPKLAHPLDDFSHVDPDEFTQDDIDVLAATQNQGDQKAATSIRKLRDFFGAKGKGMERLDTVFKWILATFHDLCTELNRALDALNQGRYEELRLDYINRLRDLDDHEPERKSIGFKGQPLDEIAVGKRGYGRSLKWVHVDPIIVNGRIIGLRVIVHWNPHSSSNGVPILH